MKFKVGDYVVLRADAQPNHNYGNSDCSLFLFEGMYEEAKRIGIMRVTHVYDDDRLFDVDMSPFAWHEDMFDLYQPYEFDTSELLNIL